jgi:hypothetical protein
MQLIRERELPDKVPSKDSSAYTTPQNRISFIMAAHNVKWFPIHKKWPKKCDYISIFTFFYLKHVSFLGTTTPAGPSTTTMLTVPADMSRLTGVAINEDG